MFKTSIAAYERPAVDYTYMCNAWKLKQMLNPILYILLLLLRALLPACPPDFSTAVLDPRFTVSSSTGCANSKWYSTFSMVRQCCGTLIFAF
jgi:hypothetical protein